MTFDAVARDPPPNPEPTAPACEGDGNARDPRAALPRLCAPAVEELEKGVLVRRELFERLTRDPWDYPRHQPAGLAHLDHRDNRMILIQRGEASVQVSWF